MKSSTKISIIGIFLLSLILTIFLTINPASAPPSLEKISLGDSTIRIQSTSPSNPVLDIQLIENTDQCFVNCHAILKFHPYQDITLPSTPNQEFRWDFIKAKPSMLGLRSYSFKVLKNTSYSIEVPEYSDVTHYYEKSKADNETYPTIPEGCSDYNETHYACTGKKQTGSHEETRYRQEYHPFSFWGETLQANKDYYIKLEGKKYIQLGPNNVDWIPTIKGFEISEWAPWYSSYSYRYPIYSNATTAGLPISVNDTYGIGDSTKIIWTQNCTEQCYVYCENSGCATGGIEIGNETDEKNWENETSRTGNNARNVWNDSVKMVIHYGERTGTQANDSSQYGNNGSVVATWNSSGLYDYGMSFNGSNSYVNVFDSASLSALPSFTLETWWRGTSKAPTYQPLINKYGTGYEWYFFINNAQSGLDCYVTDDTGTYMGTRRFSLQTDVDIWDGNWHHLVCTYNGSGTFAGMAIYVDGHQVDNSTDGAPIGAINDTINPIKIGIMSIAGWRLNGTLDETRVWNISLGANQINQTYWNGINNLSSLGAKEGDTTPPSFSNHTRDPKPPNEDQDVMVNVIINETGTIDSVWLNFSGAPTNWTVTTNVSSEYYYTIGSGNYTAHDNVTYTWFANDSFGNLNSSKQSFIVANRVPSAPTLANPKNNSGVALGSPVPEFNWSVTDEDDEDNESVINYTLEIYYFNNTPYTQINTSNNYTTPTLPTTFDQTYHWRVRANDSYNVSDWSVNYTFQYANWTITFNVTDAWFGNHLTNIEATCTNGWDTSGFPGGRADSPFSTDDVFAPENHSCTFSVTGYFDKTETFTADEDEIIVVEMIPIGGLTPDEHTWLEWLYDCWHNGTCKDLLEAINLTSIQINETVNDIWNQYKRTNQSIVATEDIINKTVSATSNLTINYSINVPIKEGYTINETSGEIRLDYLPIRISYWFLNYSDNNKTCYSQGNYSVATAEPYCQPLTVYTVGQINSTINFTVDLRPSLPSGNYTIVRNIEIDPEQVWINYGMEAIGVLEVKESNIKPMISIKNTGTFPGFEPASTTGAVSTVTGWSIGNIGSIIAIISVIAILGITGYFLFTKKRNQYQGYSYKPF